jgi:purine nucleoside phosphorylase
MLCNDSAGSRRQVCVRADRTPEDTCSAFGWTGTVSIVASRLGTNAVDTLSFYEGHTMDLVTFATRVCKLLGVETMIGMLKVTGPLDEI